MQKRQSELVDLILVTIVLGFCFSFRDWGLDNFNAYIGLKNFLIAIILTALSISVHELAHEFIGQKYKVRVFTKTWKPVLLLAVIVTFLTNGWIVFAAVWSILIISPVHRLGRKFPHAGPYERAKIALVGPLVNLVLFLIAGALYFSTNSYIFQKLMFINGTLAVFNLFPFYRFAPLLFIRKKTSDTKLMILHKNLVNLQKHTAFKEVPFMEGELIFFGSRPMWAFIFSFAFFVVFVMMTSGEWISSVISSLVFAFILYLLWMFFLEPWTYTDTRGSKKPRPW